MFKIASIISLILCTLARAQFDEFEAQPIPGEIIVHTYDPQALDSIMNSIDQSTESTDSSYITNSNTRLGLYTIAYIPPENQDRQDEINQVFEDAESSGQIIWSEQNRVINAHGQTGSLWVSGVDINAASYSDQYALEILDTSGAHALSKGQGVLTAVVDTGIDATHPEFQNRISNNGINLLEPGMPPTEGGNGVDEDQDGHVDEAVGHGTFISGLSLLVAPKSHILPVKVLNSDGMGDLDMIAAGIEYAVSQGAHVIVLALGTSSQPPQSLMLAINDAHDNGATIVAAVGNGGLAGCLYPASDQDVIAVGATDHLDLIAPVSNYAQDIAVMLPGSSTVVDNIPVAAESIIGPLPGNEYAAGTGTSMSTGLAAGAAALVRAQGINWPSPGMELGLIHREITTNLRTSSVFIQMPPGPIIEDKPRVELVTALQLLPYVPRNTDINGDGSVNGVDLSIVLGSWGALIPDGRLFRHDIIRDEIVNGADLAELLGNWSGSP